MRHSTRRLLPITMGWLLVWLALVAVPSLALAGSRAGYDIGVRPPGVSTSTAPGKPDMATVCQTQYQAALRARVQAARDANDPVQM
jgi:hypothetical protein